MANTSHSNPQHSGQRQGALIYEVVKNEAYGLVLMGQSSN